MQTSQFIFKDSIFAICLKNDSKFAKILLDMGIYEKTPILKG